MQETYEPNLSFSQWNEEDKPREKLLLKGKHTLTDAELLAILLRTGTKDVNVMELSKRVLSNSGNDLNALGKLNVRDFLAQKNLKGLGETKAITLVAALELGRRRQSAEVKELTKITTSKDGYNLLRPLMADLNEEEFHILLLNKANKVIGKEVISTGGRSGTVADPRVIFKTALLSNATGIIIAHNHPSGNLSPSSDDISLTKKMKEAGNFMEIKLLDHLIITDKGYYSFADEGAM
jgi:DNA repair protein RadC